jgi:hypothetical protein
MMPAPAPKRFGARRPPADGATAGGQPASSTASACSSASGVP